MISATRLDVTRGGRRIVTDVYFHVEAGCALSIRGENGSGKSSLMAALAGLLPCTRGSVSWRGVPIRDAPGPFKRDLAYLGHADGLSGELTVAENIRFATLLGSRFAHASLWSREQDTLDAAGLSALRRTQVKQLSQGQRRRVALARLVLADKPLWLLDEPTDALDDAACAWFAACIDAHLCEGGTVVAATHRPLDIDADRTRHLQLVRSAPCSN